jgi:hypothetical protein
VWTGAEGAPRETWVLDAQGRVIEHGPGVRIAVRDRSWQWKEAALPVKTHACPRYDDDGNELAEAGSPPEAGTAVRATLERLDGAEGDEVVSPESDEGAQEIEQTVTLVATVGPYLFVRDSTYAYTCGAHGNVGVSFLVWDAERHAAVWSSPASDGEDIVGAAGPADADGPLEAPLVNDVRVRALAALGVDEDVSSFGDDGKIETDLTEIVPAYAGPDGSLSVSLQFTAASCYACSDGAWSSYTKSTLQPLATLPAWLRPWATPPESVRAFLREHPELAIGGWSTLPAS